VRAPELGSLSREEAASLVGFAPFDDDSGGYRGQRHIKGGRSRLRKSIYAAAFPAAFKWNPQLVAFYQRLTRAGKPHKLALVACARKLFIYVNAVLARDSEWVPRPAVN
jgi:transposase